MNEGGNRSSLGIFHVGILRWCVRMKEGEGCRSCLVGFHVCGSSSVRVLGICTWGYIIGMFFLCIARKMATVFVVFGILLFHVEVGAL